MRADIHGGPEHMLQSEAGYIDARPKSRQLDETLLRRTAGPYMWVKGGHADPVTGESELTPTPDVPDQRRHSGSRPQHKTGTQQRENGPESSRITIGC